MHKRPPARRREWFLPWGVPGIIVAILLTAYLIIREKDDLVPMGTPAEVSGVDWTVQEAPCTLQAPAADGRELKTCRLTTFTDNLTRHPKATGEADPRLIVGEWDFTPDDGWGSASLRIRAAGEGKIVWVFKDVPGAAQEAELDLRFEGTGKRFEVVFSTEPPPPSPEATGVIEFECDREDAPPKAQGSRRRDRHSRECR